MCSGALSVFASILHLQVDVLVLGHLLEGRFPTLWRHLAALEVDSAPVALHWLLCMFLNSLPMDSTLRVWDLLFFEHHPVVLFRVALALVEIYDQVPLPACSLLLPAAAASACL